MHEHEWTPFSLVDRGRVGRFVPGFVTGAFYHGYECHCGEQGYQERLF